MKIRKSERGQALAEYMPLIPPILLLSVLILVPLSDSAGDIFCQMVNSMEPEKCLVAAVEDVRMGNRQGKTRVMIRPGKSQRNPVSNWKRAEVDLSATTAACVHSCRARSMVCGLPQCRSRPSSLNPGKDILISMCLDRATVATK